MEALALLDAFTATGPRDPEKPAPPLRVVLDALRRAVTDIPVQVDAARAEGYALAVGDVRWLAEARAQYSSFRETGNVAEYRALSEPEQAIHNQVVTARQVGDLLTGDDDGMGWLPSWLWDEWAERRGHVAEVAPAEAPDPGPYTAEDHALFEKLIAWRDAEVRRARHGE